MQKILAGPLYIHVSILIYGNKILVHSPKKVSALIALQKRHFEAMIHKDTTSSSPVCLQIALVYIHSSGVVDNKSFFHKRCGNLAG